MLLHNVNMWLFVKSFLWDGQTTTERHYSRSHYCCVGLSHEFTVKYEELQVSLLFLTLCGSCESVMRDRKSVV